MNRREAVILLGALFTGTIFGAHRLLAGAITPSDGSAWSGFSADEIRLLDEIGETILPATPDSGGAKAAAIGAFMQEIVRDFYTTAERATFTTGLLRIESASREQFAGRTFLELTAAERETVLLTFERTTPVPDAYLMLKQLTVWGYFSSEIGSTQALAHVAIPGRYEGCLTVSPDMRPWSE